MIFNWRRKKKQTDNTERSSAGNRVEWVLSNPVIWKKLNEQSLKKNKKK